MTRTPGGGAPPAGPYVVKKLRELDAALVEAIPRVVKNADEEAIHDLRVAIRRLRTLLKMARPLFGRWHADAVRKAFAEVMKATGDLRDEEVLEETLEGVSEDPAFASWLAARAARERKLRRNVLLRIERGDLDRARLMLKALLVFPFDPEREEDLSKFARRTVERARRVVEKGRDVPPEDILGLHELRISYKELRYSIELLAEALPLDARAMLEPAVVFQKRLGEIHDADVAVEVIRTARNLSEGARTEALASLEKVRAKRLMKYLRELDPLGAPAPPAVVLVTPLDPPQELEATTEEGS
ncbi:MAG TPA: CHAD domain-containing protein [Labilithrix sp.]|nr:CHAD domain-containing protein [Labilithrix sp.]